MNPDPNSAPSDPQTPNIEPVAPNPIPTPNPTVSPLSPVAPSPAVLPSSPATPESPVVPSTPQVQQQPSMMDVSAPTPSVTPTPPEPTGGIVIGGASEPESAALAPILPPKRSSKKKKLLLIALPLLAVLLIGGGVFGLYLPNTPDAIWSKGINRTGTAVDKLVSSATDEKQLAALTTSELTGTLNAKFPEGSVSGDITAVYDKTNSNSALNVKVNGNGEQQELGAKLITKLADGATYPDVYFQLSGFSPLGLDSFAPGINAYDGKWITVDSAYIQSLSDEVAGDQDADTADITSADISEISKAVSNVTQDYVFSTDKSKAVLVQKSFVGKETLDGNKAHHYKATIDEAHAKDYCRALIDAVLSTKAYKNISSKDDAAIATDKTDASKSCNDFKQPKKDLDVWIGGKYTLIQKIRVHDDSSESYADIGQKYNDGDDITLYTNVVDPKQDTNVNVAVTTNVKTYKTKFDVSFKSADYDVTAMLTAQSTSNKVDAPTPTGALKIQDVMTALGVPTTTF